MVQVPGSAAGGGRRALPRGPAMRRCHSRTKTKKTGTKNTASTVPLTMPPNTPVPMACWVSALAPDASISGTTPSAKASEVRSEEHTSELQSQSNLVCRLLLEKKKKNNHGHHKHNTPSADSTTST